MPPWGISSPSLSDNPVADPGSSARGNQPVNSGEHVGWKDSLIEAKQPEQGNTDLAVELDGWGDDLDIDMEAVAEDKMMGLQLRVDLGKPTD